MKTNVGSIDRILRIVVGLALVAWAFTSGNPWFYLGVIPLFTGAIGWCPAYLPIGLSTKK